MDYVGIITNFHWHPMVEFMPSILQLEVKVLADGIIRTTEEHGSIPYLSAKYGFIVDGNNYDFTSVVGRKCRIRSSPDDFYLQFVRFTNSQD